MCVFVCFISLESALGAEYSEHSAMGQCAHCFCLFSISICMFCFSLYFLLSSCSGLFLSLSPTLLWPIHIHFNVIDCLVSFHRCRNMCYMAIAVRLLRKAKITPLKHDYGKALLLGEKVIWAKCYRYPLVLLDSKREIRVVRKMDAHGLSKYCFAHIGLFYF